MSFDAGAITGSIALDRSPMTQALAGARSEVAGFTGHMKSAGKGIAGALFNPLTAILGGVGLGLMARQLSRRISASMGEIDAASKTARSLDITTEALGGLNYAAGRSGMTSAALAGNLATMNRELVNAIDGGGRAGDSLAAMGLDAQSLINMKPDAALAAIADGLQSIENPAKRSHAMMQIFGRSAGPEMADLLAQGSGGISELAERAVALGATFDDVDARKVEQANDALADVSIMIKGTVQAAAIALAPYITAIADKLTEAGTAGGGMGQRVGGAVEWVAWSVAKLSDYLELPVMAFRGLQAVVLRGLGLIVKGWAAQGRAIEAVVNLLPGVKVRFSDTLSFMSDELIRESDIAATKAGESWNRFATSAHSTAVTQFFADAKANADALANASSAAGQAAAGAFAAIDAEPVKAVEDALKSIRVEIQQFDMGEFDKMVANFASLDGVSADQIQEYRAEVEKLRSLNAQSLLGDLRVELDQMGMSDLERRIDAIRREGLLAPDEFAMARDMLNQIDLKSRVSDALATLDGPVDKYTRRLEELRDWLATGAIGQDQFDALTTKLRQDTFGDATLGFMSIAGSAEAMARQYDEARGVQAQNFDKQQVDEQKKTNEHLGQLITITRSGGRAQIELVGI